MALVIIRRTVSLIVFNATEIIRWTVGLIMHRHWYAAGASQACRAVKRKSGVDAAVAW